MKDPRLDPGLDAVEADRRRAVGRQPPQPVPHHLEERAEGAGGGGFGGVNYLEFPSSLTGVEARIVALVGKWFPTGAHKVGAAFGCLVPRLVTGQFDPDDAEGRLAVDRQLLPRRRLRLRPAGLPVDRHPAGGHEPGALRVAVEGRRRGDQDARHRNQRQGDLRQVLGAAPIRPGPDDLQPVRRVRELPLALRSDRSRHAGSARAANCTPEGAYRGVVADHRVGGDDRLRRLPEAGLPGQQDRRRRGAAVPDPARERLRRPPHRRHRRQARALDPQRQEHRPGRGHRRRGGGSAWRGCSTSRSAGPIWADEGFPKRWSAGWTCWGSRGLPTCSRRSSSPGYYELGPDDLVLHRA